MCQKHCKYRQRIAFTAMLADLFKEFQSQRGDHLVRVHLCVQHDFECSVVEGMIVCNPGLQTDAVIVP